MTQRWQRHKRNLIVGHEEEENDVALSGDDGRLLIPATDIEDTRVRASPSVHNQGHVGHCRSARFSRLLLQRRIDVEARNSCREEG